MASFSSIDRPRVLRLFAGPKPYYIHSFLKKNECSMSSLPADSFSKYKTKVIPDKV